MKFFCYAMFFWALTAMGCVTTHEQGAKGTVSKAHHESPPPPVTAAQVQKENAHNVSEALWDEMDRQAQNELLHESAAVPPKK